MIKTYIIAHDEYMGIEPNMYELVGTYRQLLWNLMSFGSDLDMTKDGDFMERTEEELSADFKENNGDGQPLYQVWCVEDRKRVF